MSTLTPLVSLFRFLCIELVYAERAWAAGMELKQATNTEPRKRFHLLRRLNRAKIHASQLSKLCEECSRCDARTRLEAQVCAGRDGRWGGGGGEVKEKMIGTSKKNKIGTKRKLGYVLGLVLGGRVRVG